MSRHIYWTRCRIPRKSIFQHEELKDNEYKYKLRCNFDGKKIYVQFYVINCVKEEAYEKNILDHQSILCNLDIYSKHTQPVQCSIQKIMKTKQMVVILRSDMCRRR